MLDLGLLVTVGVVGIGAVVEVIRLEGRLNGHDLIFDEREKAVIIRHTEINDRLERIERKLDESLKLNGSASH